MAVQTLDSREWHEAVARLMDHLDRPAFPQVLVETINALIRSDGVVVFLYRKDSRPEILCDDISEDERRHIAENYIGKVYLLGPVYGAYRQGLASGVYAVRDLAPSGFWYHSNEYFKIYYQGTNLIDEAYMVVRLNDDSVVLISIGRDRPGPRFGRRDKNRLRAAEPVIRQAIKHHWGGLGSRAASAEPGAGLSHRQLKGALENFGASLLTSREGEVARMMLQGHSGKSVARELQISPETVKIHRKHLYQKLDITSQAELFSLFIGALSCLDGSRGGDPLAGYLRLPA
ncbi:MAG: LuxR C-terminal-related transcriptional regulator [Rhodospirillales bacterium]